ncbi:hypothetical protein V1525DRAFT_426991 [Lipomyces kononenkoae]|uniref:Uncharacterized protein n=1 Tax=Lipomyces kononenkoae TaxID=34357 RepID=A0ACC3SY35_LIPKO
MAQSDLLEIVRRPLSPDTRLEVSASREEYQHVDEILERDGAKGLTIVHMYPQLWYDSVKGVAIVVAPRTPLHSRMDGAKSRAISAKTQSINQTGIRLTTRAWDGALQYRDGSRLTLMVAVEVGVSQSYRSLQAAVSWSVCALRCRLGLAMSISEGNRGETPHMRYYASIEEAEAAAQESENDFQRQLLQHPYGPLERYGVIWFGKVRQVILETYRSEDDNCLPETLLVPSQSFTVVENGEYVGHSVSPNLRELVLKDCVPSHLMSGRDIQTTPVNFFDREWFEGEFRASMVSTAIVRVRDYGRVR